MWLLLRFGRGRWHISREKVLGRLPRFLVGTHLLMKLLNLPPGSSRPKDGRIWLGAPGKRAPVEPVSSTGTTATRAAAFQLVKPTISPSMDTWRASFSKRAGLHAKRPVAWF